MKVLEVEGNVPFSDSVDVLTVCCWEDGLMIIDILSSYGLISIFLFKGFYLSDIFSRWRKKKWRKIKIWARFK